MAFYLFPKTMFQRYLHVMDVIRSRSKHLNQLREVLMTSCQLYESYTMDYYGMGWFLQFFPGTQANKARHQLMTQLEPALDALKQEFSKPHNTYYSEFQVEASWMKKAYLASLDSYIHLKPWYLLLDDLVAGFTHQTYEKNKNKTRHAILLELPLIKDLLEINSRGKVHFKKNAIQHALHSLVNPLRLVDSAIHFIHSVVSKLVEKTFGTQPKSQGLHYIAQAILDGLFGILSIPIKVLKQAIDLFPLQALKTVLVDPLIHVNNSLIAAYSNRNKAKLMLTVSEMREVKLFRQALKSRTENYAHITKKNDYATIYIGLSKELLYSKRQDSKLPEKIISIQASKGKIVKLAGLLAILREAQDHGQSAKLVRKNKQAIAKARIYYPESTKENSTRSQATQSLQLPLPSHTSSVYSYL